MILKKLHLELIPLRLIYFLDSCTGLTEGELIQRGFFEGGLNNPRNIPVDIFKSIFLKFSLINDCFFCPSTKKCYQALEWVQPHVWVGAYSREAF